MEDNVIPQFIEPELYEQGIFFFKVRAARTFIISWPHQ
jgi:hypothetical protein